MAVWLKRSVLVVLALAVVGGFVFALRPQAVPVDAGRVARGEMEVTIDEEGVTRIQRVYTVSAPVAGRIDRIGFEVGDQVEQGMPVAAIHPVEPSFIDERTMRELRAGVDAAQAAVGLANADVARARTELELARSALARAQTLAASQTISTTALEKALADVEMRQAMMDQAEAARHVRESELESARARLVQPGDTAGERLVSACCIGVSSPVNGVVLKLYVESEGVVVPGTALMDVGDPADLEAVVDLLSSDAVAIGPGTPARIVEWGGDVALDARVRRIEPVGVTKVSALGIEEQRVDAVLDFVGPNESVDRLGHGFRIVARIATWHMDDALTVPLGALFRSGGDWAVYRIADRRAQLRPVAIGQRNAHVAQVLDGLEAGDLVVLYPSDQVTDGSRILVREVED